MAGEPAGDDEDRVDADIVVGLLVAWREPLGRDNDAADPPGIERHCCGVLRGTCLHLDEGDYLATSGNDIDFSACYAGAAGQDAPAVKAEAPARESLRAAAALFSGFAVHFERSRARA